MAADEIVEAMSDAFWNVYDAEIKLGAMNWTDNRDAAMRAAFAIADKAIRADEREPPRSAVSELTNEGKMSKRPVLVTTEFRGVFFGYADDTSGDNITLENARNCIYWPSTQGGFGGLASEGPKKGARIGARVDRLDLRKVTAVAEVSEAAAKAWEAADVYRG
jgi:hypothetical protein